MNDEWINPGPGPEEPVKQGDLLVRRAPANGDILQVCLVITADCDISQDKFAKELAALLVVPLHAYVRSSWAVGRLQTAIEKPAKNICAVLNKWNSRRMGGDPSGISLGATIDWLRRDAVKTILDSLDVPESDQKKVRPPMDVYRKALSAMDARGGAALDKLIAFKSVFEGTAARACLDGLIGSVSRKDLPTDVFLLPHLPQLDYLGAVVLHREIVGIPLDRICFRAGDATTDQQYLRLGRLAPTFKYAVSQSFGMVYSRIGRPVDHEARCDAAIETLALYNWGYT